MDPALLKQYLISLAGTKYFYSGDDPVSGFDCSGLACEFLRATGLVSWNFRTNAQGLLNHFEHSGSFNAWGFGALAFYGQDARQVVHVGICLDSKHMIEAGGGGPDTTTAEAASDKNAFVRIRPIKYRKDFLCVIKPFYAPPSF